MKITPEEALARGWITLAEAKAMGLHKYHAQAVEIDGHKFPSQHEADRYCELKLLERAGAITNLRMQVRYTLEEGRRLKNGKWLLKREYVSDFEYDEGNRHIIEDAKGMRTREYKRKIKEFIDLYVTENIEFREV
jgi:hypothetical protein